MRPVSYAALGIFCLLGLSDPGETGAPVGGPAKHPTRQQLIGAWRLVMIDYAGPHGETVDPFYQAGSSGIIIYDPTGWMSVQITAPNRRAWEVPAERVPLASEANASLKAEAFDTYYSYYGTWNYDDPASVVTHHVKSSVIPAETEMTYVQTVTFEGARLVFTVRSGDRGMETVRRKVWERL